MSDGIEHKKFLKRIPGKLLILLLACAVFLIAAGFLFSSMGVRKIREDTYAVTPESVLYAGKYYTSGTVFPQDPVTLKIPGNVKKWLVREGEKIDNGAQICVYTEEGAEKTFKSTSSGIVLQMDEQEIRIANPKKLGVSFEIPSSLRNTLAIGDKILAGGREAKISFLSGIAKNDSAQGVYEAEASLPSGADETIGSVLPLEIRKGEETTVWKVSEDCVIRSRGKDYVFYPSWLSHVTDLKAKDYAAAKILHYEDGYYYMEPVSGGTILKLSEFTREYLSELVGKL